MSELTTERKKMSYLWKKKSLYRNSWYSIQLFSKHILVNQSYLNQLDATDYKLYYLHSPLWQHYFLLFSKLKNNEDSRLLKAWSMDNSHQNHVCFIHLFNHYCFIHSFIHELFSRYLSCAKYSNVLRLQWYKRKSLLLLLEMRIIKKVVILGSIIELPN